MSLAIREAKKAFLEQEVPVGAVAVYENKIIAKARNSVIKKKNPLAHAEMELIARLGKKLNNFRYPGVTIFTTVEPCPMCISALLHARIDALYYGTESPKWGFATRHQMDLSPFNHRINIHSGILKEECAKILREFFKKLRA